MLRTATLALVHSTAEYCAPVWYCVVHTRFIDPAINDALQIVTGCQRPTPPDNLPILAGIQPAELRHKRATLSLAHCAMEPGHLLHSVLSCPEFKCMVSQTETPICTCRTATHQSIWQQKCGILGGSPMECGVSTMRLHAFIPDVGIHTQRMALP